MTSTDYEIILKDYIPLNQAEWKNNVIKQMIDFSDELNRLIDQGKLGILGGPWELNLRDLIRWCQAITDDHDPCKCLSFSPVSRKVLSFSPLVNCFRVMDTLYVRRFRTAEDRKIVRDTYRRIGLPGSDAESFLDSPSFLLTQSVVHIEDVTLERVENEFHGSVLDLVDLGCPLDSGRGRRTLVRPLVHQLPVLQILGRCVKHNWLPILVSFDIRGK